MLLGTTHPFSTRQFRTDGKRILADLGEQNLLRVATGQWEASSLVRHTLQGVEYEDDRPNEW